MNLFVAFLCSDFRLPLSALFHHSGFDYTYVLHCGVSQTRLNGVPLCKPSIYLYFGAA